VTSRPFGDVLEAEERYETDSQPSRRKAEQNEITIKRFRASRYEWKTI
jgi:hypothetical protein